MLSSSYPTSNLSMMPGERYVYTGQTEPSSFYDAEKGELNISYGWDTNLEKVLGTQPLLDMDNQRLKVDMVSKDLTYTGILTITNNSLQFGVTNTGYATAVVQVLGTWAGTITFEGSNIQGGTLTAIQGVNISSGATATTTTVNAIFRFSMAGLKFIQARFSTATSGQPQIVITLSNNVSITAVPNTLSNTFTNTVLTGALTSVLPQKGGSANELFVYDQGGNTSLTQNALTALDNWNPGMPVSLGYQPGDTVSWNGQTYRCILTTWNITPQPAPSNATYFILDPRQNKSLVSNKNQVDANQNRLRVETEFAGYDMRIMEQNMLTVQQTQWDALIFHDYELRVLQGGVSDGLGTNYAQSTTGMSYYTLQEIR